MTAADQRARQHVERGSVPAQQPMFVTACPPMRALPCVPSHACLVGTGVVRGAERQQRRRRRFQHQPLAGADRLEPAQVFSAHHTCSSAPGQRSRAQVGAPGAEGRRREVAQPWQRTGGAAHGGCRRCQPSFQPLTESLFAPHPSCARPRPPALMCGSSPVSFTTASAAAAT